MTICHLSKHPFFPPFNIWNTLTSEMIKWGPDPFSDMIIVSQSRIVQNLMSRVSYKGAGGLGLWRVELTSIDSEDSNPFQYECILFMYTAWLKDSHSKWKMDYWLIIQSRWQSCSFYWQQVTREMCRHEGRSGIGHSMANIGWRHERIKQEGS